MTISGRFGFTGRVDYQYGHGFYHYRVINGKVFRFGVFTNWIDGRKEYSRELVTM